MKTLRMMSLVLATSVSWAAASEAASVSFNLKYGLWEVTSVGTTSGTPPLPAAALANMSPAQKAQMAAAMTAVMASINKPKTYKSCITAESLQRGFKDPELSNGCTQTIVSSSASEMEVKFVCTGREKMAGDVHFQTPGPEAMSGTVDMTLSEGGVTMKMNRQMTGKWVSADCGDVKP